MSHQPTLPGFDNAISSPALADGAAPSDLPAGPTTGPCGPDRALASHSASPELAQGYLILDTSGRNSVASSRSADLQRCLESRLQADLAETGSPLYVLTWKRWDMQSGPQICALRASARRTSDSASGLLGWQTPVVQDSKQSGLAPSGTGQSLKLSFEVQKVAWPTPTTRDWKGPQGRAYRGEAQDLPASTQMAGWPTPAQTDHKGGYQGVRMRNGELSTDRLDVVAQIAGPARITDTGVLLTGSTAGMESGGQLNPALSRWLMGYPPEWDDCGVTAMPSSRKSRRRL